MVAPLGGKRSFPQIPTHWITYGQPGASWMAWYVRAVERWLGLPGAINDKNYLSDYLEHLEKLIIEQITYYKHRETSCHNTETRLHWSGVFLLSLTLLACGLHLLLGLWLEGYGPAWLPPLLTFFCGFFPALGAALAAVVNQGEFRRLTKRSKAMHEQLSLLIKDITKLPRRSRRRRTYPRDSSPPKPRPSPVMRLVRLSTRYSTGVWSF